MSDFSTKLLGNSPEFLRVLHTARILAVTDTPVLITGEPGVGKATIAREIHSASPLSEKFFSMINCAGIADSSFESKLQHSTPPGEKGLDARPGTLLFAEIAELSPGAQAKLLHFMLDYESVKPAEKLPRLIASSSADLQKLVDDGKFRQDLFYRLNVVPLRVPSLRERVDDILLLLKRITAEHANVYSRRPPRYSITARNLLKAYSWPGNLRELRNFCERMVILLPGQMVQPENLPLEMRQDSAKTVSALNFLLPENGIDLSALECDMICQAIEMAGGNRSKAARLLGISRDTLLYRVRKYAIEI